jgi:thiamine kinase-like enzyme
MIRLEPPQRIEIGEYVLRLKYLVENKKFFIVRTNHPAGDLIYSFIDSIVNKIFEKSVDKIPLVFSHGDFSLVNILKSDDGIKVIDWEDAARRNPLYDLYNYFFTESYYGRTTSKITLEVNAAIKSIQARLVTKSPEIAAALLPSAEIYRWLYYLERVGMLLGRDFSSKILEVILRSIEVFNACEENYTKS